MQSEIQKSKVSRDSRETLESLKASTQLETQAVVRFDSVVKKRGETFALNQLSFEIQRGEIVCLLGPNGAGKSTSIQHLLGSLTPDSGKIEVLGGQATDLKIRRRIGCTPQDTGFPENLTCDEILRLVASHYVNGSSESAKQTGKTFESIDDTISRFGLSSFRKKKTGALSGGQKRCLALACAFVGNPDLVLLDEPTTGLDVDIRRRLWDAVREYSAKGGTVLFTTHYLEEAEELATRILVINRGVLFKSGNAESIKASFGLKQVIFQTSETLTITALGRIENEGNKYRVWTSDADHFVRELTIKHSFKNLEVRNVKLEDAFVMMLEEKSK